MNIAVLKRPCFIAVTWVAGLIPVQAEITTYDWPTAPGQAIRSEHYRVFVREGDGPESEVDVLQANAIYEGGRYVDGEAADLKGRTFSFAQLSYLPGHKPARIRIEKISGDPAEAISVAPRSYNLVTRTEPAEKKAVVEIDRPSRYFSVTFDADDNRTRYHGWIKHMLAVFVDPAERDIPRPGEAGVVRFDPERPARDYATARVVYFPPGYHDLTAAPTTSLIRREGELRLANGQAAYLAGGAYVEGHISGDGERHRVFGRGVLTGRRYEWNKKVRRSFVELGGEAVVEGITITSPPLHGVVSGDRSEIRNVKIMGWHWNNDGFRPGWRSKVRDCFMRCADDFFYNYALDVRRCVLWPAHNGSILTFGWQDRPAGGSLLQNIDIISPEWVALQNNNGLVMSQNTYTFRPSEGTTVLRDIRIEGSIPGIVNIKPHAKRDAWADSPRPLPKSDLSRIGHIGEILLEDITVEDQFSRGVIRGGKPAISGTDIVWPAQNIAFTNVSISGVVVDDSTKHRFLRIDTQTTRNLTFSSDSRKRQ